MPAPHHFLSCSAMLGSPPAAAAFLRPLSCLPAVLPPELWLPCSAPASRSWEEAFGEGSEASRAFAGRNHARRLCQPPAGSCALPGAFGETAKIQMLQRHRAGNLPQELTPLLLFYPARQACPGCLNQSLLETLHFP